MTTTLYKGISTIRVPEIDTVTQKVKECQDFMKEQIAINKNQMSINDTLKNVIIETAETAYKSDVALADSINKLYKKYGRLKRVVVALVFATTILTGFIIYFTVICS